MQRDLGVLLPILISFIPETEEKLISDLNKMNLVCSYRAPENQNDLWYELTEIVNESVPQYAHEEWFAEFVTKFTMREYEEIRQSLLNLPKIEKENE